MISLIRENLLRDASKAFGADDGNDDCSIYLLNTTG